MNFCGFVHDNGIPLVISPILWLGDNPEIYPVAEISGLLGAANIICPNSRAEADQLASYFRIPKDKFVITHNGIDSIFSQSVPGNLFREKFSIHEPFLLCVANIEPRKNQQELILAARETGRKLVLIGNIRDKSYYDHCMSIADGSVEYLGYLDHHDPLLRSAYSACDVFVLPSTLETPGLAALEAAACNARIVITDVGATREYFEDDATYVSPHNRQSIIDGILKALESDNRPGAGKYLEKFSWTRTARQLIEAYEKAVESRDS